MNEEQRIKVIEEELKVLKNEVKAVLLDLREQYLNIQNPFNFNMAPNLAGANPGTNSEQQDKKETESTEESLDEFSNNNGNDSDEENTGLGSSDLFDSPKFDREIYSGSGQEAPGLNFESNEPVMPPGLPSNSPFINPPATTKTGVTNPVSHEGKVFEENIGKDEEEIVEPLNSVYKTKNKKQENVSFVKNGKYDLVVVAGLTQWVDQATMKLGKERAEALVEMSFTMGRIPENLKDVLIKMARLSRSTSDGHSVTATDYLAMLAQMENLLGNAELKDNALLSLLSMNKESASG